MGSSPCIVYLDCGVAAEACLGWSELFGSGASFGEVFRTLALTRISVIFSLSRTDVHFDMVHLL